jgi:hypothetical protein
VMMNWSKLAVYILVCGKYNLIWIYMIILDYFFGVA